MSVTPLDPERVGRIRRRAHLVLDGTVPQRLNPLELALVLVFSVAQVAWALGAVIHPV